MLYNSYVQDIITEYLYGMHNIHNWLHYNNITRAFATSCDLDAIEIA